MGNFFRDLVERSIRGGEGTGPLGAVFRPLAGLYGTGVRARLGLYRAGVLKPRALSCAVISVGNITVGGSGKTPMTMFIASYLKGKGAGVAVVSRGYGGSHKGAGIVSRGEGALMGPGEAGDEPVLMARRLKGVPVVIGAERFSAGQLAIEEFSPDVIILDDGFQHIGLKRDLNILLVDGNMSLANARLLPAGPLREPLTALSRADMVLVKGGRLRPGDRELINEQGLMATGFVYRAGGLRGLASSKPLEIKDIKRAPVLIVSAIADPESFSRTLSGLGIKARAVMTYSDHHAYDAGDIKAIKARMEETGAEVLITTEKDGVKLEALLQGAGIRAYALAIDVEIKGMGAFRAAMAPFARGQEGTQGKKARKGAGP